MTETSVVILNYNGKKLFEKFLHTVISYTPRAEIIVADNGSTDDSIPWLQENFPQVKIIDNQSNLGFCAGYNKALQQVHSPYYVLLNSDVEVTPHWLEPLILLFQNPSVAAVQPKILSWQNKNQFEYAGAAGGFIDTLAYPFCRGRIFSTLETDRNQYNDCRPIFWATGACLVIRSAVFHQLGGFNERFFAHMEEIDLCWKINRLGQQVFYEGKSTVYHLGGGTLSAGNPQKTFLNFRNGLSLLFQHTPASALWWKLPVRLALDFIAACQMLLHAQPENAWMILKSHRAFMSKLAVECREKNALKNRLPYSVPGQYKKSILWKYFIQKKKTFPELNIR